MDENLQDLITITIAAERAGVARNTIHRAAKTGKIKAIQLGRNWYVRASDLERWKREEYRPEMAYRYPVDDTDDSDDQGNGDTESD